MQIPLTCWPDRRYTPATPHAPPIDEPMRSLLRHRLSDLERRLSDMSQAMDQLLQEALGDGHGGWPVRQAPHRSHTEEAALADVRAALARFDDGSYGLCTSCAAPIEPERLASRPQVMRCRFCEQQGQV